MTADEVKAFQLRDKYKIPNTKAINLISKTVPFAISFCNGICQMFEFPDYILNNMRESALNFEAEYFKSNRGSSIQSVPGASLKAVHNQIIIQTRLQY